jgi:serine/threonine protein phosphatase PrpC
VTRPAARAPAKPELEAWAVSLQGLRPDMEDSHVLEVGEDRVLGAVFDGHRGAWVASLAARSLPALGDLKPGDALRRIDEQARLLPGGACAVVFRLRGERLEVANLGDAVLVRVTGGKAEVLTQLHRIQSPRERDRVLAAGAEIHGPYAIDPRTGDGLMPTRSLGDPEFRRIGIIGEPYEWQGRFRRGWLVAACDGLWDVFDPAELPPFLQTSAREAAEALAREALDRGAYDNVTVITVRRD